MPLLLAGSSGAGDLLLVILVLIGAPIGLIWFGGRQLRIMTRKIELLAESLQGKLLPADADQLPSIAFMLRGHAARFSFGEEMREFTRVTVHVPSYNGGRLILVPAMLGGQLQRLAGLRDIAIGDRDFDREYIIQAQPESLAHRVFDPSRRREVMDSVGRLAIHLRPMIRAENGRVEVWLDERCMDPRVLLDLVRTASDLVLYLTTNPQSGIEWGESAEDHGGRCPICTTGLQEPLVRCHRCKAPHHRECWDYLGRCAVYGCDPPPRQRVA